MDNPFELILQKLTSIEQRLAKDDQSSIPAIQDSPSEIIDEKKLCTRLGITHPTCSRWRKKGKIPFLQVGSAIRYNWPVVVKALENKKAKQ